MLLINNQEQEKVLSMAECIDALESAYRQLAAGEAIYRPRMDLYTNTSHPEGRFYRWGSMEGALSDPPVFAIRTKSDLLYWVDRGDVHTEEKFCVRPGLFYGLIQLYSTAIITVSRWPFSTTGSCNTRAWREPRAWRLSISLEKIQRLWVSWAQEAWRGAMHLDFARFGQSRKFMFIVRLGRIEKVLREKSRQRRRSTLRHAKTQAK